MRRNVRAMREWAKHHKVWAGVLATVIAAGVIGAVTSNDSSGRHKSATKDPRAAVLQEAASAPEVSPPSEADVAAQRVQAAAQRAADRAKRRAYRMANGPRVVEYLIKGTTRYATMTYTSTGDGTAQRDVTVVPEWRSATAKLRRGDFAQVSAQNSQEYGSISCKIVEHLPDGSVRTVAPVTTSSGAFAIVDCNGTVR